MPILNLNNPAFISVTGAGRPNSGGSVAVYAADGLFTTLATIYSDQQKTTPLTNPVTLDDAGAIEIWYEVKVDIQERLPDGTVIRDTLNLDPNAGDAVVQGFNLVDNGSFEVDETSDGQPDNWTITPYVGSAIAITETIVRNGKKALEFNTAGAGTGGGVATSVKFPVTEGSVCSVTFSFYATNATTLNTFKINWYDQDDVLKSTSTVTMPASGSVPTSWTEYQEEITVDAAGTQGEVELTGISSGGSNLSSKAYFDGIMVTNEELIERTLTAPIIDEINDSNGNESIIIATTPSAVTELTVTNAATGNPLKLTASGETNAGFAIDADGTGEVNINSTGTGNVTIEGIAIEHTPAFRAHLTTSPAITAGTPIVFDTESFDITSDYAVGTGRFLPTVAGIYSIYSLLTYSVAATLIVQIRKNGVGIVTANYTNNKSTQASTLVEMNGTTDYLEITGSTATLSGSSLLCYFQGHRIQALP